MSDLRRAEGSAPVPLCCTGARPHGRARQRTADTGARPHSRGPHCRGLDTPRRGRAADRITCSARK